MQKIISWLDHHQNLRALLLGFFFLVFQAMIMQVLLNSRLFLSQFSRVGGDILSMIMGNLFIFFGFWFIWWAFLRRLYQSQIGFLKIGFTAALAITTYQVLNAFLLAVLPTTARQSGWLTLVFVFLAVASLYFWQLKCFKISKKRAGVLVVASLPLVIIWYVVGIIIFRIIALGI